MSLKTFQLISMTFFLIVGCAPQAKLTDKNSLQNRAGQQLFGQQAFIVQTRHRQKNGSKKWLTSMSIPVSTSANSCSVAVNRHILKGIDSIQVVVPFATGNKRVLATILRDSKSLNTALLSFPIRGGCIASQKPATKIKNNSKKDSYFVPGKFSYFITASRFGEDEKIHYQRGMAVSVKSTKDTCVLLTNKHIVSGFENIMASRWSGEPVTDVENTPGQNIYNYDNLDASLISIASPGGCAVANIAINKPIFASPITVLGHIEQKNTEVVSGAVSKGIVSGYWETSHGQLMVSDVLTALGYSGSGVFDKNNKIIGLVTGKTKDDNKGFAYIIPISQLTPVLTKRLHRRVPNKIVSTSKKVKRGKSQQK